MENNSCVLNLNDILFDEINFKRHGSMNNNKTDVKLTFKFDYRNNENVRVWIRAVCEKRNEYSLEVVVKGIFSYTGTEEMKQVIVEQNATAIVFPYLRSQISFLTAQPGMTSIIIPPINIAKAVEDAKKNH